MPFDLSIPELLIILVVALLVFGPKRLPEVGKSLGKGLREFRGSVSGILEQPTDTTPPAPAEPVSIHSRPAALPEASSSPDENEPETG